MLLCRCLSLLLSTALLGLCVAFGVIGLEVVFALKASCSFEKESPIMPPNDDRGLAHVAGYGLIRARIFVG